MPRPLPVATYRVQLTKDFGFRDAAAIVPYLKRLGISHLYASPFLAARPGSTHGYDIVDHNRLNPELGGEDGFEVLSLALKDADLGLILDFVPNHMGVGLSDNKWWLDVLENGLRSRYARYFDIDWRGLSHRKQPGVLLPILGKTYGETLEAGEIQLKFDAREGSFAVSYYEHKLPIDPVRYRDILNTILNPQDAGRFSGDPQALKSALAEARDLHSAIETGLSALNAPTANARALLHRLLERQHYQLASWRIAFSAINYRRFFDVNDLAGLRPEHQPTFDEMHRFVAQLIAEDKIHGLRLDHIDGLLNPVQYLQRLQRLVKKQNNSGPIYLLVEKILEGAEPFPPFPGTAGTTGYERLNAISNVLLEPKGLAPLEKTWRDFTGEQKPFDEMLSDAKLYVIENMLASEFGVLHRMLARIAAGHLSSRDFAQQRLFAALRAYVVQFPVYRTYITTGATPPRDRLLIAQVIAETRKAWSGPDQAIFDFLEKAITADLAKVQGYSKLRVRTFAMKLQQFTGPLMAKALEDTTFYRYNRLLALNEVGGEPAHPLSSVEEFHQRQRDYAKAQLHGLTATATHDTKRGEDARMRILAISELANEWSSRVRLWAKLNARFVTNGKARAPSAAQEYFLYQALLGAWEGPAPNEEFIRRSCEYAVKAAREEKRETNWMMPDQDHEDALLAFLRNILDQEQSAEFLRSFDTFARRASVLGVLNGFSQLALKIFLPGIPDFYQGTELQDFSFVDPDNRRPVDYGERTHALDQLSGTKIEISGRFAKFWLTKRLLQIRGEYAELLSNGSYEPLSVEAVDNVIGFHRKDERSALTILCGRHYGTVTGRGQSWTQRWRGAARLCEPAEDLVTGRRFSTERLELSEAFAVWPVVVLRSAA